MKTIKPEPMNMMDDYSHMLPSFSLTEKNLPEIKDWKVGKKYKLEIEVEMVSVSKNEYGNSPMTARFKVHKVGKEDLMSEEEKQGRKGKY